MRATVVGLQGDLAGRRFAVGGAPVTFGRGDENDIVLPDPAASRVHAEIRQEADGYVITDRGSSNGTWVNGIEVRSRSHRLRADDEIVIGNHTFRFDVATGEVDPGSTIGVPNLLAVDPATVLRVTVTGGGPVGLAFSLLLADLMGPQVAVRVYDGRWKREDSRVVWKGPEDGNVRRLQVVTVQSRQFRKLPQEMQDHLFTPGDFTEMWPAGPDSVEGFGPRNIRIAYVEDRLLDLANHKRQIELVPHPLTPSRLVRRSPRSTCWRSARAAGHGPSLISPASSARPTRPSTGWTGYRSPTWCWACG